MGLPAVAQHPRALTGEGPWGQGDLGPMLQASPASSPQPAEEVGGTWPAATAAGEECIQMATRGGRTLKLSGNGETQPETSGTHFTPTRTAGPTKPSGTSVGRSWRNQSPYTAGGGAKRGSILGKQS